MTVEATGPAQEDRRSWAMWDGPTDPADAGVYEDLASFVVDSVHVGAKFKVNVTHDATPAGRRAVAEALYDGFVAANLPYRWQAWSAAHSQWIKDPVWFAEQSGTCLDFAMTYAAVLLDHDIAPVLAVLPGHAYICVDLTRNTRNLTSRQAPMFAGKLGSGRVIRVDADMEQADALLICDSDYCLPVDITLAASTATAGGTGWQPNDRRTFEGAIRSAQGLVDTDEIWLVDVVGIQDATPSAVRVPFDAQRRPRPAITTLVPDVDTRNYRPQTDIEAAMGSPGAVGLVLHGAQGLGKSMAALVGLRHHQARAAWLLNATDRQSLVTSLAFAELAENQLRDSAVASSEEAKWFAGQARARLARPQPWVVVLDNAEAGPAELADLVPVPRGDHHQRLVVTTTNPAWATWAEGKQGWQVVEVAAFDEAALDAFGVPADGGLRRLVAGRGLFAAAFARAVTVGVRIPERFEAPSTVEDVDPAASALWAAVDAHLVTLPDRAVADGARRCAQVAAWVQPDRIPVSAIETISDPGRVSEPGAGVELLIDVGVLERYETGTVRIHRLVAAAIRASMSTADALAVVGAEGYADDARYRADAETQRLLEELLGRGCAEVDTWVAAAHSAITLFEHRGKAADADGLASGIISRLADRDDDTLDRTTALRLADALHARARVVNQGAQISPAEAREAIEALVIRSARLRSSNGDRLGVSKSTTMEGLLLSKASTTVDELKEARDILAKARDERERIWGRLHEDTARAVFNLGPPNIRLAQRDPERAAHYLDEARQAYTQAWDIRQWLFPTAGHPFKAASDHGLALADYYEAIIVHVDNPIERQSLLRSASTYAHDAALVREVLDGQYDAGDTIKSTSLAAKIADARAAFAEHTAARLRNDRSAEQARPTATTNATSAPGRGSWPEGWPTPAVVEGRAGAARSVLSQHRDVLSELSRWGVGASVALPLRMPEGVSCVITTRHGGFGKRRSDGNGRLLDFATLNLADHVGDDPATVAKNRRLVCDLLGVAGLTVGDQQHGDTVAVIDERLRYAGHASHAESQALLPATDAMVTNLSATPLCILVADCVPVALFDPVHRAIGVAHAGRGGTVAGILPKVVDTMTEAFGTCPADLHVAIGPHIGREDYEVGPELVQAFLDALDGDTSLTVPTDTKAGKASLDLEAALRRQLDAAGVAAAQVWSADVNTRRATDTFFSDRYTRSDLDGAQSGRFGLVCWIP